MEGPQCPPLQGKMTPLLNPLVEAALIARLYKPYSLTAHRIKKPSLWKAYDFLAP